MKLIAERMSRFEATASSIATARARALAATGRDIIRLSQGEPDFPTPDNVKQAVIRAMERDETKYTPTGGTPEMKAAIIHKFKRDNNLDYTPDQVMAGNGGKQIIFSAMVSTIEEGDEAIVTAPYWVAYPDIVKFVKGVPVAIECAEENGFRLQAADLERAITPRTKWLFLNSPNNPCGSIYTRQDLLALGEVLLRHPHVYVLSDDIYEHILFDGHEFATIAEVVPALKDRVLTVNGASKAYSMTGWRLGFAGGPEELIRNMSKLQNQNTGNPSSISQAAAIEALTGPQDLVPLRSAEFQKRRDMVVGMINDAAGLSCSVPEGAFYVYANCSGLIGRRSQDGKTIATDEDVVMYLLNHSGVAAVHGAAYGLSPYFRISTAASMDELREACARIQAACQALF
ncbi:MAG: pyridoxal phosphate-dependent aminotransferase [Rhodospirillales bacterium]|nr:pyridoxal phosphate-dependent aminotransferase [Rhodospirillales bacterium]